MRRKSRFTTLVLLFGLLLNSTNIVMAENQRQVEAKPASADFLRSVAQAETVGSGAMASLPAPSTRESPAAAQNQSFTALTAGGYHTCALSDSGGVMCWGANLATYGGQLGDGTFITRSQPKEVSGLTSGVTALTAGLDHTCVVMANGALKCWGYNLYGQLGDGTFINHNTPVDVTGPMTGVTTLVMGGYHSCAVTAMGGVKCWGSNTYGQLGDGTTISRTTPVDVTGLITGVTTVAAGGNHTCAITPTGGVKCWGYNAFGQLGDGATVNQVAPVEVSGLITGIMALAAGNSHTCALSAYGGVKCWGDNSYGQLGDGTTLSHTVSVEVSGLTSGVTAIAAGTSHTCAILADGGMKCWGDNSYGQLGDGTTINRLTPVAVTGLTSGVSALATGGFHTCALMAGGQIKCWGRNSEGQLGDGAFLIYSTPTDVLGLTSATSLIATRLAHTCAVMTDGGMKCWGANSFGQLGDGTTNIRSAPVEVTALTTGTLTVAPGWYHTCVVTTGGGARCWGQNSNGKLGDGTTVNRSTAVEVTGLISGVTALASGWSHTCALTANGGVKCWGGNFYGQLGNGMTAVAQVTPTDVISLPNGVAAITAGYNHTCALTIEGGVKCWGDNRNGQLGDGTVTGRLTPVDVTGLISGVVAIEAGYNHTCALTTERGMKCWGWNSYGQLGDGTTLDRLTPENVSGLTSGVSAMAAAWYHTCAVMAGGSVKCWGGNGYGQLGDGTVTNHVFPVDVIGLITGTTTIVAGHDHTCAMTASAGVKCWGSDFGGQVGTGRLIWSATPLDVVFSSGPDLGLSKWAPSPITVGTPISYSLAVNNHGTMTATGVIVTDTLPVSVTFISASSGCSYNAGLVTCNLGTLAPYSGTATVSIVATASEAGWVHNTAQVGANEADIDPADNSAGADTNVVASGPTVQFDAAAYRVSEGAGMAIITVTLSAPAVMTTTMVSYASLMTGTATAGTDYTPVTGTLFFGFGQTTATFAVPILEDALSEPDETVLLALSNPFNATLGPTAVTLLTILDNDGGVIPGPDLGLTKWAPSSVAGGSPISYSLVVNNHGTLTATGVIVTDTLPLSVTFISASPGCSHNAGLVICNLDTLAPYSGTATVSIVATASEAGWVHNTAQVGANEADIDPADNSAGADTNVVASGPTVQFDAVAYRVSEGAGTAIITVTLSAPAAMTTTMVSYASLMTGTATAGTDYTPVTGTLFFGFGQTTATFAVPILEDALSEPDETVLLALSNPFNATLGPTAVTLLTILDNDGSVTPGPDLGLTKWAPSSVAGGSPISYSLVVNNHGTLTATGVIVTDSLPLNVTFIAASPACSHNAGLVICNLDTLAPYSGTATVSIIVTAPVAGWVNNTAQVGANEADIDPGDNSAGVGTAVVAPTPSVQFDAVAYRVSEGAGAALVTVTLSAPAVVTTVVNYASLITGTATAGTDYTPVSGMLVFRFGQITATFTVPIVEDALSEPDETVLLALSNPTNATLGSPTVTVLTILDNDGGVTPGPDLGLTKWAPSSVAVGSPISYSLVVNNHGTMTATGVIVTDTLPLSVTFISASSGCSYGGGLVICNLGTLAPYSGTATVSIVATASEAGWVHNTAQVSANEADTDPADNFAGADTNVTLLTADMSVTKWLQGMPLPGEQVQYQIYFRNDGLSTAEAVVITDTLPGNVEYLAWYGYAYNPGYTTLTITPTIVNNQLVWNLGSVVPGGYGYLYPGVRITDTANVSETLVNIVRISTNSPDTNPANNLYTHTVALTPATRDVYVSKSLNSAPGAAGSNIEYRIHIGNQGNATAREIVITDTFPADMTYVSDRNWSGFTTLVTGNMVVWTRAALEPNSSADLYLQLQIADTASSGEVLTNVVRTTTGDPDIDLGNNVYTDTTRVEAASVDLGITKYAYRDPRPGEEAEYTLYYWNQGTTSASNVRLTDTLPAGATYVWSSGAPAEVNDNIVAWTIASVPPYGDGYLNLRVRVTDTASPGVKLVNTAQIAGTGLDVNPGNNNVSYTTTVRSLPGHITGIVTAPNGVTPLANISIQVYRNMGDWWNMVGWGSTDLAGNYDIGDLEPGVYRVQFYDWSLTYPDEYYNNQSNLESAADISVTAGAVTRYINASLNEPAPPVAQATASTGSVYIDPKTGEVNIDMSRWNKGNITVTKEITCAGGLTPTEVTLVLAGTTGLTTTYPMIITGTGSSTYWATLPADQIASGDLATRFICPGNPPATDPVGKIYLYDPSGQITDALTGDPVEGAQVDLFKVPGWQPKANATDTTANTCETNLTKGSADWDSLPPAPTELGIQVDPQSGEIDPERNPLFTNSQGRYGWNVAQGCWYIVVQKAGYVDRVSPLVGVPPEVTDLDLALTPTVKTDQAIEFSLLSDKLYGNLPFTLTAAASSGLPVTFTTSSLACTVDGNLVTLTGVGSCAITAHQGGNTTYNAAPDVSRTFLVAKADQAIIFDPLADKVYGAPTFTLTATASSGLPVTFTTGSLACTVVGAQVTLTAAGSCAITAHQVGDGNYNAAPDVTQSFTIARADTAITLSAPTAAVLGQPMIFTAAITSSVGIPTGIVTFTLDAALITRPLNNGLATYTTNTLSAGSHLAMAVYGGDARFKASQSADLTVTVTSPVVPIDNLTAASNSPTALGHATTFTATIGAGSNVTYAWAFGDGTSDTGALVSHTYPTTGNYTAVVTAANSVGSVTKTIAVVIVNGTTSVTPTATASAVFPSLPGAPLPITLTVLIPAGAVANPGTFAYAGVPSNTHAAPAKFTFAGANFRLEMYQNGLLQPDYQFNSPITLTLAYNPANLSVNENSLELRYWNGSAWVSDGLTLIQRDTAHHQLVITLTHLSEFALLGQVGSKVYLPLVVR